MNTIPQPELSARITKVRELAAARPSAGLDMADLAALYAERFGALSWQAQALADEVDGAAVLGAADLPTVLGALDHAETLMRERAEAFCETCSTSPAGACHEHLDQLDQADAYRQLARRLGGAR